MKPLSAEIILGCALRTMIKLDEAVEISATDCDTATSTVTGPITVSSTASDDSAVDFWAKESVSLIGPPLPKSSFPIPAFSIANASAAEAAERRGRHSRTDGTYSWEWRSRRRVRVRSTARSRISGAEPQMRARRWGRKAKEHALQARIDMLVVLQKKRNKR